MCIASIATDLDIIQIFGATHKLDIAHEDTCTVLVNDIMLFQHPKHPYMQLLLSAAPDPEHLESDGK